VSAAMRDLAPDIVRQRLLIEGLYEREITQAEVERYLVEVAAHLSLRTYGSPIVHAPGGAGKDDNEGFDAFIPLIDSGISLYVWSKRKFFATVLFTCKAFDAQSAVDFTRRYFAARDIESRGF
jgi:S-adenosylmethionine decarboxylase